MLPYLLAAVGGYLIGSSLKSEKFADGGKIKYPKYHGSPYDRGHADSYYGRPKDPHYYPEGTYEGEKVTILTEEELAAYNAGYDENTARKEFAKGGKVGEFESIMKDNVITEKQILLIKKRLNADKDDESVKAVVDYIWDEKPYLTPEQNQKGLEYLMNLWKSPTGKVRSTNPYGYREQEALETFESFQLSGYHDVSRYGQKPQFVPQYIVNGKETSFEYYVDGKINIVGKRGMEVSSDEKSIKHFCLICDSAYIETTQQNVEYVCNMCRDNLRSDKDSRALPNKDDIIKELVTDYGNM